MCAVVLVLLEGFLWWWAFEHSSFNVGALLAQALAMLSVGVMIISHVMLRYLGESLGIASDDPTSPARIRPSLRPGGKGDHDALTIVLDTRTGQVTGQHASHSTRVLQLTDSVLLDGATAYALNTGEVRWTLPNPGSLTGGDVKRRDVYSGAAGHSSFVLLSTPSGDDTGLRATATVVLVSDPEPDAATKVRTSPSTRSPIVSRSSTAGPSTTREALMPQRSQGTASNPLILLDSVRPGAHIFHEQPELTPKTTTIVSLNPADGSVRWARETSRRPGG